ncbi:ABC transporter permease [Acidisarcina polymorpha]|uniref:ABC transporter permease n=1 Tax=Acidisarcina polymorpha TaxID=2211140 RepID=UPI000DEFE3DA|nr:ABC transporter permease [Acidisarcina polymorpha]
MTSSAKPALWEQFFWPLVAAGLLLAVWQFSVVWTGTKVFPSPVSVEKGLIGLLQKHVLWSDIGDSLRRVALGFGFATVVGVPVGLALGWYPAMNQVVNPVLQVLRPISPIAWIPIAIIFFGVGDRAAIFLIFLAAFFPIVVACISGVSSVPAIFRRAGRNFGLSPVHILSKVIFPAALPQILIGLRLALGVSWLVVVAAEMIAVDSGLGYLVIDSRNSGKRYDLVVGAMLIIGLIGLALDTGIRRLEKIRSVRWGFRHGS